MLYHHTNGLSYEVAASEAAKEARAKMEAKISQGEANALAVIEKVYREVPVDRVVKAPALSFIPVGNGIEVGVESAFQDRLHPHALGQMLAKAEMPKGFADYLIGKGAWGVKMVADNLNQLFHHDPRRYLLRSVEGELRGFLSDRYRRLDSRPIVQSFGDACKAVGALPYEGYAMDTRVAIKAVFPQVFEPVDHEVISFGICLGNSDYGSGALTLSAFIDRLWCSNKAIMTQDFRRIHLGSRLTESIQMSDETHKLDGATMASMIGDIVKSLMSPETIAETCDVIKQADAQKIDARTSIEQLKKKNSLTKGESEKVSEAFNGADIEMLPPGQTVWRLSNAISWIANQTTNTERKLELMELAGDVLKPAEKKGKGEGEKGN